MGATISQFSKNPSLNEASIVAMDDCQDLGEYLRQQRQGKGLSLNHISAHTKITLNHLQALEDGCYGQLPAETYLRGFLVSYAELLDLPVEKILEWYRSERPEKLPPVLNTPSTPMTYSHSVFPLERKSILLILLLFVALAAVGTWWLVADGERVNVTAVAGMAIPAEESVAYPESSQLLEAEEGSRITQDPIIPAKESTAIDSLKPAAVTFIPKTSEIVTVSQNLPGLKAGAAIALPAVMQLKAIQPVAVEVTIDGRPVQSYTLDVGSLLRWRIRESLNLQIEPPDGVQVSLGGSDVNPDRTGRFVFPPVEN